jgi:hypothetical protein
MLQGEFYIKGFCKFDEEPCFNLPPNSLISSIGDLKSKSSHSRNITFPEPCYYRGTLQIKDVKFMAVEIPNKYHNTDWLYKLFIIGTEELYVPDDINLTIKIYKPIFSIIK